VFRKALRSLINKARDRGLTPPLYAAIKEIDRRLHLSPQFGQPLRDLQLKPAQLWLGVVAPLVVHYMLDEEKRLVVVLRPPLPLPRSGLQP
jgi:hypothetical protein